MVGAGPAPCKIHCVALSTLFQVLPRAIVSIVVPFQWRPAIAAVILKNRVGSFVFWGRENNGGRGGGGGGGAVSSSAIDVLSW